MRKESDYNRRFVRVEILKDVIAIFLFAFPAALLNFYGPFLIV